MVGRERVLAGTDCGFGTFAGIGKMDAGISYAQAGVAGRGRTTGLQASLA